MTGAAPELDFSFEYDGPFNGALVIAQQDYLNNETTPAASLIVTDLAGNVISHSSAGAVGFKGSRKSTPFAAQLAGKEAIKTAMEHGMRVAEVRVKGPGVGREAALRALQVEGFTVTIIRDVTPIPHNGCRPPKRRRV